MKTNELTGAALDWAVAKCEGVNEEAFRLFYEPTDRDDYDFHGYPEFHYSTVWSQGGPIIKREDISFRKYHNPSHAAHGKYYARVCKQSGTMVGWHKTTGHQMTGPTPLIAAMRCYVASKLGDEVDIPEELQ